MKHRKGLGFKRAWRCLWQVSFVTVVLGTVVGLPVIVATPVFAESTSFGETIDVHLVEIPILAHDRNQRPIDDLTLDDLTVRHAGRDMAVAFLTPFTRPVSADEVVDARVVLDMPGGDAPTDLSTAPNRIEPGTGQSRNILLFIDVENDQPLGKFQAAHELIRFVETELDPSFRVAVLSYGGTMRLDQTFTHDRRLVTQAIRAAFDHPRRPQVDLQRRLRDLLTDLEDCIEPGTRYDPTAITRDADDACVREVARRYADEVRPRADDFVSALESLVRYAGGLAGRKSIVAVSHGLAVNPATEVVEAARALFGNTPTLSSVFLDLASGEGARAALDTVLDLAIRNEVTLHFVDRTNAPTGDHGARQGGAFMPGSRPMLAAHQAAQLDLQEIARTTGGLLVANSDVFEGVRQALAVEQGGYVLGYYTDARLSRQALAKVSVRSRKKGVRIQHRRGSYAQPQGRTAEQGGDLRGHIAVGRPEVLPTGTEPKVRIPFRLDADPRDLGYALTPTQAIAQLTLHVRLETHAGRRVAETYHFVSHGYPESIWQARDEAPITIDGWVEVPRGDYRLVARVQNAASGLGGEIERRITIADRAARSSEEPAMSTSPVSEGASSPH